MKCKRSLAVAVVVFATASRVIAADAACPAPHGSVYGHLNWCAVDHGYNEGARCGYNVLRVALNGLPDLPDPVLGNAWDRTNMMGAARLAYSAGWHTEAIDAAVCCQEHNKPAQKCLSDNRGAVNDWLAGRSARLEERPAEFVVATNTMSIGTGRAKSIAPVEAVQIYGATEFAKTYTPGRVTCRVDAKGRCEAVTTVAPKKKN